MDFIEKIVKLTNCFFEENIPGKNTNIEKYVLYLHPIRIFISVSCLFLYSKVKLTQNYTSQPLYKRNYEKEDYSIKIKRMIYLTF